MKKIFLLFLCICIFFCSSLTGLCIYISAPFTNSASPMSTAGSVELAADPNDSSNTVAKIIGFQGGDSYLSTGAHDFSMRTYISFEFYRVPGSTMRFYFRDSLTTSNNITIASIGTKNISLGGTEFPISDNTWYTLRIILDKPNDKVSYSLVPSNCTDAESETVIAERKLSDYSTYAVHTFNSTTLRFSISKTSAENIIFYFDDILIRNEDSNISFDSNLFLTAALEKDNDGQWDAIKKVTNGNFRNSVNLENFMNSEKKLTIVNAIYDKNGLMKSYMPNTFSISPSSAVQMYIPFSISDLADGDYLKTFIFDSEKNIAPMSHDFSYQKLTQNYNSEPQFDQIIIDYAVKAGTLAYASGGNSGNAHSAAALYYLLLTEHMNPETKSSSGNTAKDKALSMIRHLVAGGNEPSASVGCYWTHPIIAASMLLAKNTPAIWNEFTADEKDRIDWLMRCLSIAGNWGFNDQNNYLTGFDLTGNFNKSWNPNYRNAYLNVVIAGAQYFGADELNEIFVNFDYDTYIKKLTELGYTNILSTWTVAGKDLMENGGSCVLVAGSDSRYEAGDDGGTGAGVKIPFTYQSYTLHELEKIFDNLMRYTYSHKVVSSVKISDSFTAGIASGKTSPYEGLMGMMREFHSGDGGGTRSSASYCIDSLIALIPTYANLKLFSDWKSDKAFQVEVDELIFIGTEDLIFKCEEGYNNYSLGNVKTPTLYNATGSKHYNYTKDIWRAFHMTFENPYI